MTYVLHNTHGLFSLGDEFVLGLLDLLLGLRAELVGSMMIFAGVASTDLPGVSLGARLDRVQCEAGLLDVFASTGCEHQVRVQRSVPTGQISALDLGILGQTGLAESLTSQRILLESGRKRILAGAGVLLV